MPTFNMHQCFDGLLVNLTPNAVSKMDAWHALVLRTSVTMQVHIACML